MNIKITEDLIQEATKLLERWVKRKKILPKGKVLCVSISIKDSALVNLTLLQDKTPSPEELDKLLSQPIRKLGLSTRAQYCIENGCIKTIGTLTRKTEEQLLCYRNLGRRSLNEIKDKLSQLGLNLGADSVPGPLELKAIRRSIEDQI